MRNENDLLLQFVKEFDDLRFDHKTVLKTKFKTLEFILFIN